MTELSSLNVYQFRLNFEIPLVAEEMEKKDEEMKDVIQRLWPIQSKKMLELLVPAKEGMQCIFIDLVM